MRKICLVLLFFISFLKADITLDGYLHPGDNNNFSGYTPKDPITNEEEHTYDYYLHNPSKFYLSEDINVTKIELLDADGIEDDSNISVYIDGNLIATGNDGSSIVNFNNDPTLTKGFHSIAVTGSCYVNQSEVNDCNNGSVDDIDDFYFSGIKLYSSNSISNVYNFIQRHHTGDTTDEDDNYDINETENSYYPDAPEATKIDYNISLNQSLTGFRVFISRLRDIHENGINKLEVYDMNESKILDYDLNHTNTDKFDFDANFSIQVDGISRVSIVSGGFSSSGGNGQGNCSNGQGHTNRNGQGAGNRNGQGNCNEQGHRNRNGQGNGNNNGGGSLDDLSWDEFIFIPYLSQESNEPIVEYRMDECSWDSDANTFEIKNYGSLGDEANATAVNGANVTDGKINNGGDFVDGNKALISKSDINLGSAYTINLWVKFPLNDLNHKKFTTGRGRNKINVYYFNIADRPRSDVDYIYFKKDLTNSKYYLCIYGDDYECKEYNFQNLNGWHMLSYVIDSSGTKFYVDDNLELTFTQAPINTTLGLLLNSDYGSSTDNNANGQSIGADVDEFKIFNDALNQSKIEQIYGNENSGKNWDDTPRDAPQCDEETKTYKFDAWDTWRNINDRNISTKIVNKEFNLTIASLDESGTNLQEFNGTVCAKIDNNISKIVFNEQNSSTSTFRVNHALKDVRVELSWKRDVDEGCPLADEDNSTVSTDNFAIRPKAFYIDINQTSLLAGELFHMDINATDELGSNAKDYNETNGTSFRFDFNDSSSACSTGVLKDLPNPFRFRDGNISFDTSYSDVGDINFTIKEIGGSEFARVDADDTNDTQRFIKQFSKVVSVNPYQLAIVDYNFTKNNFDNDWLYMSDVDESNITVAFKIQAQNRQGEVTKNFDSNCYAKDVNFTIDFNTTSSDANISFYRFENNSSSRGNNITLGEIDWNSTIYKDYFSDGNSSKIIYALNVYKEYNLPKDPLGIELKDINTSNSFGARDMGLKVDDNGSNFYFARVKTKDITTTKKDVNHSLNIEVYCNSNCESFTDGFIQSSINWYVMKEDSDTRIGDINASSKFKGIENIDSLSIDNLHKVHGVLNFNILNDSDETTKAYFHIIDMPKYLWYSRYKEFNNSSDADCSTHPCFYYEFNLNQSSDYISSGDFNGSTIGEHNATIIKKGVKVFR